MTVDDHAAARIWHGQQAGAIAAADVPDLDTAWKHIDAADAHLTAERAHRYELAATDLARVCSHAWQTSFNLIDTGVADPMIWNGHELVSSGHPEDDDPWCKNCGIPADEPDAMTPCRKQPEPDHDDDETCACDMRHPDDDTPFTHHPHCIIGHATTGSYHGRGPGR